MENILPEIEKIIAPIVEARGYELVEMKVAGVGNSSVLRVFVHREGGITIDEIAKISNVISNALDEADLIHHKYFLEVSSPGLDRELTTLRDFMRIISKNVRVQLHDGNIIQGKLVEANPQNLVIATDDSDEKIPFSEVSKGKIVF